MIAEERWVALPVRLANVARNRGSDMKRRTKIIAIALCTLAALAITKIASDPIYGKLLVGTARVLTKRIPITLEVGDQRIDRVWCFRESNLFHGGASKRLILWLESPHAVLGREILVVDLNRGKVYLPNSSTLDYKLISRRWLVQSEGGDGGVAFGDSKLDASDPHFQQSGKSISFTIPPMLDLPSGRWNVKTGTSDRT
jgi:hypothetical protein